MYIGFEIYRIKNCVWYDSYCYNKHFDYYGLELFNDFLYSYNKSRYMHYFRVYDQRPLIYNLPLVYFIDKYNKLNNLSDEYCKFYLQERYAIYCGKYNYKYDCLNYMKSDISWNYLKNRSKILLKWEE